MSLRRITEVAHRCVDRICLKVKGACRVGLTLSELSEYVAVAGELHPDEPVAERARFLTDGLGLDSYGGR